MDENELVKLLNTVPSAPPPKVIAPLVLLRDTEPVLMEESVAAAATVLNVTPEKSTVPVSPSVRLISKMLISLPSELVSVILFFAEVLVKVAVMPVAPDAPLMALTKFVRSAVSVMDAEIAAVLVPPSVNV